MEQHAIYEHDLRIARTEFAMQQDLARQKVIAPLDLRREESKVLAKELPVKQIEAALFENITTQSAKRKEIFELAKVSAEQRGIFLQAVNTMRSSILSWKLKYTLMAPTKGKVYYSTIIEDQQIIEPNQEIFYVGPDKTEACYGEIAVPQQNLGKVHLGQQVIVKFAAYPFQESGAVLGNITYISQLPSGTNTYLAKVRFPKGLVTTYNIAVSYRSGMSASAEIITNNTSLAEKILYNFRKVLAR